MQIGWVLRYVIDQTEELCKLAVQKNWYVIDQTKELCKLAVQKKWKCIRICERFSN